MFEEKRVRPRATDSAKIIKVIETKSLVGFGTNEDPCRIVTQYWDFDGLLLATVDPLMDGVTTIITDVLGDTYIRREDE